MNYSRDMFAKENKLLLNMDRVLKSNVRSTMINGVVFFKILLRKCPTFCND